jgi:ubiquinone/menaquinone biosynthesis C-methylase UbiE
MTAEMRAQAAAGAKACALANVEVRDGDATQLPVDDGSVDVLISNGVVNLVPRKDRAIAEVARVTTMTPEMGTLKTHLKATWGSGDCVEVIGTRP